MKVSAPDCRILIAEDSSTIIATLAATLRAEGFQLSIATNGCQALQILEKVRPDLILLDVMMPEIDGYEACTRIKAMPEYSDIPIIFLTARAEPGDIVRGFELGAVDYIAKPFHSHELLARVNTHLAIDRLRKDNERLVRAESEVARHRSVAQMVAGVAHEINTPLSIINMASGIITNALSSPAISAISQTDDGKILLEDLTEAGKLIERNSARAHKLVQDFKKVSVHQITDELEKVRLVEVVDETAHLFRVTARQSAMVVEVVNELPNPQAEWLGYPGSLSQVLLNLLSNAQRYAYPEQSGGKVCITLNAAEPPSDGYIITVRDFGKGMAADDLRRVFDPFFTTGRGKGGSGLGMTIVHTIVTAHLKGTITINSTLDEGTTITMSLPAELSL